MRRREQEASSQGLEGEQAFAERYRGEQQRKYNTVDFGYQPDFCYPANIEGGRSG